MKRFKYFFTILVVVISIILIYKNIITSNNFLDNYSENHVYYSSVTKYNPNKFESIGNKNDEHKISSNEKVNTDILNYLRSLNTKFMRSKDPNFGDVNFQYDIRLNDLSITIFCYLDNLSTIYILSDNVDLVPEGIYKIIDANFKYEYINNLIYNSNE